MLTCFPSFQSLRIHSRLSSTRAAKACAMSCLRWDLINLLGVFSEPTPSYHQHKHHHENSRSTDQRLCRDDLTTLPDIKRQLVSCLASPKDGFVNREILEKVVMKR